MIILIKIVNHENIAIDDEYELFKTIPNMPLLLCGNNRINRTSVLGTTVIFIKK
jgi:hypothetical protein